MRWPSALARAAGAAALIGGWGLLEPSVASADEPRALEPLYAVAEGCPTRKDWAEALGTRLPEPLRAHAGLARLTIRVSRAKAAGADGTRYAGELGSVDGAASEVRRVNGASCVEVVQALALIAALGVQRAVASAAPTAAETTADVPEERAPVLPDDAPPATGARASNALRVGAVAFALVHSLSAPRWTADVGVGVSLKWRSEHLQPWLMLGLSWGADEVPVGASAGVARFERWSSYWVGCPVRFPRQTALALRPCASLEVGRLSGRGVRVNDAAESPALLANAGMDLRLEWSILERLELGAQLGGVVALSRPRFYFSPEFTALEVPAGGVRTGASASLSF